MKPLIIGLAVGLLLSWSSYAKAKPDRDAVSCKICQANYNECYESIRGSRLSCGRKCSGMLKLIRSARDAQALMDTGRLVCGDGTAPIFDLEGQTLDEVRAEYDECKMGCNEAFSEARAGCREQRTVCLAECSH